MAWALILVPLALAALAAAVPSNRWRPRLLPIAGTAHLAMVVWALANPEISRPVSAPGAWLALDPPGRIILLQCSVLFFLCSIYAVGYLQCRQERPNRVFCVCMLSFLGVMSLVVWLHHLGLMWVAIELSTLVTAPLIYFNRTERSIEATWKYLLVGSVGIAMALLGTYFLAYASLHAGLASTLIDLRVANASRAGRPCHVAWASRP